MLNITPDSPEKFQHILCSWQHKQGRHHLPWQIEPTPYRVFISEMMLQQTQVATVIDYFNRWMAVFPDIETLANSDLDQVMSLWQGLGYYQRAKRIYQAAKYIVDVLHGHFPKTISDLLNVPGIGRYTAGAVMAFAYNQYGPIVDGNVRRVFCRYFGLEGIPHSSNLEKNLWALAYAYTPKASQNRIFAQSLLDLGATVCSPRKASCDTCPLQNSCYASNHLSVETLPNKKPKKIRPIKKLSFIWQQEETQLYLEKRAADGIWGDLWCLPEMQCPDATQKLIPAYEFKHKLTHLEIHATIYYSNEYGQTSGKYFPAEQIKDLGLPTPIKKLIVKYLK
jgi:A/G-specific adenine glycosylase